jgi:hypothetical protein
MIDIARAAPQVEVLLPMHDALLLQVGNDRIKETKADIENIFVSAYKHFCPTIQPRVDFGDFPKKRT